MEARDGEGGSGCLKNRFCACLYACTSSAHFPSFWVFLKLFLFYFAVQCLCCSCLRSNSHGFAWRLLIMHFGGSPCERAVLFSPNSSGRQREKCVLFNCGLRPQRPHGLPGLFCLYLLQCQKSLFVKMYDQNRPSYCEGIRTVCVCICDRKATVEVTS